MIWPKSSQHWGEIVPYQDDLGPEDSPRTRRGPTARAGRVARGPSRIAREDSLRGCLAAVNGSLRPLEIPVMIQS